MKATLTPKDLAEYNKHTPVYYDAVCYYDENDPRIERDLLRLAEKDIKIIKSRLEIYKKIKDFMLGDYVKLKSGEYVRVTVKTQDSIQAFRDGSVYFGSGWTSYSGTCGDIIPKTNLKLTSGRKVGRCWIFHDNDAKGGNGVEVLIPFKVWKEI